MDLGMDSFKMLELRRLLEASAWVAPSSCRSRSRSNYPTIDALVGYLAHEVLAVDASTKFTSMVVSTSTGSR